MIQLLLKHGAHINCKSKDGITPILEAASNGHKNVVKLLLKEGADCSTNMLAPFAKAAKGGHYEIIQLLIENSNALSDSLVFLQEQPQPEVSDGIPLPPLRKSPPPPPPPPSFSPPPPPPGISISSVIKRYGAELILKGKGSLKRNY